MATGVIGTNNQTVTTAATFIPELWSDEVIAGYQKNLVLANLVNRINHKGKKGDKALSSLRRFYTEDAGYALSTQVDLDLFNKAAALNGGNGTAGNSGWNKAVVFNNAGVLADWDRSGTGNAVSLATGGDAAIRAMVEKLDLADVPQDGRAIVLTPRQYTDMLGIQRYTEQAFIGDGNAIKTGKVGMIYGIEVYVTNAMGTTQCATGSVVHDIGLVLHKDAMALVEQLGVRSQSSYMQEYLGDLYTADTIYGVGEMRDTSGFAFVTDR